MKKFLVLLLPVAPLTASAEWGKFEYEFDEERPWAEIEARLPSCPIVKNPQEAVDLLKRSFKP